MSQHPTYFETSSATCFGWLHLPDDASPRGGVLLCPTISAEAASAHAAFRKIADGLASCGLAALRFDYPRTGDSTGVLDDDARLEDWMASIASGLAYLRSFGLHSLAAVGLRLGAALAFEYGVQSAELDALVLWDPPATGRGYLREQRALRRLSLEGLEASSQDDSQELIGLVLPAKLAHGLAELECGATRGSPARQLLGLVRDDRPLAQSLDALFHTEGAVLETVSGQSELVDVLPDQAVLPEATLSRIVAWLDEVMPTTRNAPVEGPAVGAVRIEPNEGSPFFERPIRIGARGLFGIVTEPEAPVELPPVVFLNAGALSHVGPARLWVELARALAQRGVRSLRFDLGGIGDSPDREDQPRGVAYPIGARFEIAEAMAAISASDPAGVVLAGLCSGAYHAIEVGFEMRPAGLVLINPVLSFDLPASREGDDLDPRGTVLQPYNPFIKLLRSNPKLRRFGEQRVPRPLWSFLDRTGFQKAPGRGIAALVASGVATLLICGEIESLAFERRSPRQMRQMARSTSFVYHVLHDSDHALLAAAPRLEAAALVVDRLVAPRSAQGTFTSS